MNNSRNEVNILVVDNDSESRRLTALYLNTKGYRLSFAESGQKALDIFQLEFFDLVIMDLKMPGMDGLETIRRIRAFESRQHRGQRQVDPVPIIALSGKGSPDTPQQCRVAGCICHRRKPTDACSLMLTIREVV